MDRGHPGGGSLQLAQLIEDGHGQAIRYDLQRLGLDLADVWRGALAPARALDLVEQSPDDSALAATLRGGPQHRAWHLHTQLLVALLESSQHTAWATTQAISRSRVARPKQIPRPESPGATPQRRRLDLSRHPHARPLPAEYLVNGEARAG